jgi:hypothetical protein
MLLEICMQGRILAIPQCPMLQHLLLKCCCCDSEQPYHLSSCHLLLSFCQLLLTLLLLQQPQPLHCMHVTPIDQPWRPALCIPCNP